MGAHPWFYTVPYDTDVSRAFEALRTREFEAGRYNPVEDFPKFPVDLNHKPGCGHESIEEAQDEAAEDGTRSILDIFAVSDEPDIGVVAPVEDEELEELFGTKTPTRDQILDNEEFFERIGRGEGYYVVAYENGKPAELVFAGYSFD